MNGGCFQPKFSCVDLQEKLVEITGEKSVVAFIQGTWDDLMVSALNKCESYVAAFH